MKKYQIAIIGSAGQEEYPLGSLEFDHLYKMSYEIGRILAERGCYVITGGKSGIMLGAAHGCHSAGGVNIGFIKGPKRHVANEYVDVEIVTNMGDGGDAFLIPYSADGAIVIGGGVGTLKEIAGFYLQGKPIVTLGNTGGWAQKLGEQYLDERKIVQIQGANSPQGAVDILLQSLQ